jgi:hypothetical protein
MTITQLIGFILILLLLLLYPSSPKCCSCITSCLLLFHEFVASLQTLQLDFGGSKLD